MPDGGLNSSMGYESNIVSALALDKRIEEVMVKLARLNCSLNSLLPAARIFPEVLGYIFRFNITTEPARARGPNLLECRGTLITSSSSVIIGSRSPVVFRNFGATGEIIWKAGSDSALVLEPLRWISCWMEWGAGLDLSTKPCGILSRATPHGVPHGRSISVMTRYNLTSPH